MVEKKLLEQGFQISRWIYYRLLKLAREHSEEEVCGLLAGNGGRIKRLLPIENIHHSPTRFMMDPRQELNAILWMEAHQMDLMAIYHSHPNGPNSLSETDLKEITFPETVYLLLSREGNRWKIKAFSIQKKFSIEIPVHRT